MIENARLFGSSEWAGSKTDYLNSSQAKLKSYNSNSKISELILSPKILEYESKPESEPKIIQASANLNQSFPNSFSTHSKLKKYRNFGSKIYLRLPFKKIKSAQESLPDLNNNSNSFNLNVNKNNQLLNVNENASFEYLFSNFNLKQLI